ncbi:hypothetical protein PENSPDRAFT_733286 [Peniophora sp. CONT]|nr:hypothetical protein PENSPDRAFT_733286 [Peniophora sp. CONT]
MSDKELLYCAEKLGIKIPRDVYHSGKLIHTSTEDSMGYIQLMRGLLLMHLELRARVPDGSMKIEACFGQDNLHLFSLFSNCDVHYKRERARRYSKRSIDDIRMELNKGFEGFESGTRPRLMWHWDANKCGFEYAAPWDEFNLVPRAMTPDWYTHFDAGPVETNDDAYKPQSPRGRSSRKAETLPSR